MKEQTEGEWMGRSFGETPPQPRGVTALQSCPPALPSHQPGALSRRLSVQALQATDLAALLGLSYTPSAEQDTSLSPSTTNQSMASHCRAGVLTLNSCLLQEKGSCVWVKRFKPKCSSPSPVARIWYNTKMSHRNSCFTLLCTGHNAVQSLLVQPEFHCGSCSIAEHPCAQMVWFYLATWTTTVLWPLKKQQRYLWIKPLKEKPFITNL